MQVDLSKLRLGEAVSFRTGSFTRTVRRIGGTRKDGRVELLLSFEGASVQGNGSPHVHKRNVRVFGKRFVNSKERWSYRLVTAKGEKLILTSPVEQLN